MNEEVAIMNEEGVRLLKRAELKEKFAAANRAPIFTVTTFNFLSGSCHADELDRWQLVNRSRTVGYYHEFELAEWSILKNSGDINENGYYSHAVIEQVEPGIYPTDAMNHRTFYQWDGEKYVKLDKFDDPLFDVVSYAPIG